MANYKGNITHDCALEDADGTVMGFTLAQDKNNLVIYREYGDEQLSNQYYSGLPDYAYAPPEKLVRIGGGDFRGGIGLEFDSDLSEDLYKYFQSVNMDLRWRGMGIPGPEVGTIAISSNIKTVPTPTIINGTFETGDTTGWTGLDAVATGGAQRTGTYCGLETVATGATETFTQTFAWNPAWRGRRFNLSAYIKSGLINEVHFKIGENDGTGISYGTAVTPNNTATYEEVVYSFYISPNANQFQIIFSTKVDSGAGGPFNNYWDDIMIEAEDGWGVTTCGAEFNNKQYVNMGKCLAELNEDADDFDIIWEANYDITDMEPFQVSGTDYLWLALGHGNDPVYVTAGTSTQLHACDVVWDELVDGDVTASADTTVYKEGTASLKLVVADACAAGDKLATDNITSANLSTYHAITAWIRSTTALNASDIQILLDDTASCASPLESLNLPAITANTWTKVKLALATPASDTAIISVGVKMVVDKGAFTLYVDDIKAVKADTFTGNTTSNNDAVYYQSFTSSSGTVLYKADTPNQVRSATDPTSSWSGITYVGDAAKDITGLYQLRLGSDNVLIIAKEDQPYYLDASGTVIPLIPQVKTEDTTTSGVNATVFNEALYYPCGAQSLWEYDSGAATDLSPSQFIGVDSTYDGQVFAVAGDSKWLFALLDNGSSVEVLAGRWEYIESKDWHWHPISRITLGGCNFAMVSTVTSKRLWIFSNSTADNIKYIVLPTYYGNVPNDTTLSFETGGYFITCWYDANFRTDNKSWHEFTVHCEDVDATNYFTVYYQKWGDASWTSIGDFGDDGEEFTTITIPVDASSNNPYSRLIRFKIACTSDGAAPAPRFLFWDAWGTWYPSDKRKLIQIRVKCLDDAQIKAGADVHQTEKDIRDFLWSAHNPTAAWPLSFYPPYWKSSSDTKTVKIIEPFQYSLTRIEKGDGKRTYQGVFDITMEEI